MRYLIVLFIFLCGCAGVDVVGSTAWHKQRLSEIETAYQNKDITKAEYLSLKNGADGIRNNLVGSVLSRQRYNPQPLMLNQPRAIISTQGETVGYVNQ